jgi:hypothetical protein
MRHTDYFKNFLENTVNLSKFKLETLSKRVDSIYDVLKADDELGPLLKKKIPQGSWPQKPSSTHKTARPSTATSWFRWSRTLIGLMT